MTLPINVVSSVCDQVAAWQEAFLGEANLDRFRRAAALYAENGRFLILALFTISCRCLIHLR
ncbi:hypothetical protein Y590_09150 [Methylobacterium sp. AMS5]|nr:hypothetical protein Y590_09150 [Methylobacterium sp. AMS5]